MKLDESLEAKLIRLAVTLIDQRSAEVIVPPREPRSGYWFGGGNLMWDRDGRLLLVGRYRSAGDSRTGVGAGERGLELAVLESTDGGSTFHPILSLSKTDLSEQGRGVMSIEGSALRRSDEGFELLVSSEKIGLEYPAGLEDYRKPGTGIWTIESLRAATIDGLRSAQPVTVARSDDPRFLHCKDPVLHERDDGDLVLLFCTHPFNWSSSNGAYCVRRRGEQQWSEVDFEFFPRGTTWDVAITRPTCVLDVPSVGAFRASRVSLIFYDGGESLRPLDEHAEAMRRPRGYSCEELGGLAYIVDGRLDRIRRLSSCFPTFVSPWGTGCSRYVDVLTTDDGMFATWQQSRPDGSQPLVMHRLGRPEIESILR